MIAAEQDGCATESMGPIYDRSNEHLGYSDKTIIALRKMLSMALRSVGSDRLLAGQRPLAPGVDRQLPFTQLNLGLFGYLKRVVNVNPEVTDSAFQLAMTE